MIGVSPLLHLAPHRARLTNVSNTPSVTRKRTKPTDRKAAASNASTRKRRIVRRDGTIIAWQLGNMTSRPRLDAPRAESSKGWAQCTADRAPEAQRARVPAFACI